MSVSDDVGNLFRRFGGDAGQYQEVARDDDAKHAALRWPLLNALDIAHPEPVPDAGRAAPASLSASTGYRGEAATHATQPVRADVAPSAAEPAGPARAPLFARGHRHASMPPPVAPAQMRAGRFSAPPAVAQPADRTNAAANAPSMTAAPVPMTPVTPAPAAFAAEVAGALHTPAVPPPTTPPAVASHATAPRQEAQPHRAAPFFAASQTFARTPFNNPAAISSHAAPSAAAQQQGGSILSRLFGGKPAAQPDSAAEAPSKDLATLFARLSRGSPAPARPLRDAFRSRFKADGDA